MFKIWGKNELMSKETIVNYLKSIYGVVDHSLLTYAERKGGVTIGKTKVLYLR